MVAGIDRGCRFGPTAPGGWNGWGLDLIGAPLLLVTYRRLLLTTTPAAVRRRRQTGDCSRCERSDRTSAGCSRRGVTRRRSTSSPPTKVASERSAPVTPAIASSWSRRPVPLGGDPAAANQGSK